MPTKRCSSCDEVKPTTEFYKNRSKKDGLGTHCKTCSRAAYRTYIEGEAGREFLRKYYQSRRDYVYNYLATHPCVDCGEADPVVLEFDHVRGVKVMSINRMMGGSFGIKRIQEEIDKCEVRCANCHRRQTYSRMDSCYRLGASSAN